jgi:hypothetical protein
VDFRQAEATGVVLFQGAVFSKSVSLRESHFLITLLREESSSVTWAATEESPSVNPSDRNEAQLNGKIDMRGFTYSRLVADWRELFDRLYPYDRQSYSHLETVLRMAGHDNQADEVYLARRRIEAQHSWNRVLRKNEYGELTLRQSLVEIPRALGEWFQRVLFNYGIRPYRLFLFSIFVLLIGVFVFSQPGAVLKKESRSQASQEENIRLTRSEALNVSLHQFIPIIEIPPGNQWVPSDKPAPILSSLNISFAGYATLHRIAGAILVPLGIAALTGLLRRRENP